MITLEPIGFNHTLWKNVTFLIGLFLLLVGATIWDYPDWDYNISFIMALFTYFSATYAFDAFVLRQYKKWPMAIFLTWWTVDGCYSVYWFLVNPTTLEQMRGGNAPLSLALFLTCGLLWSKEVKNTLLGLLRPVTHT
jgi:NhaP-type Na+/H+ or K+/H+ antiporter